MSKRKTRVAKEGETELDVTSDPFQSGVGRLLGFVDGLCRQIRQLARL
jgi:hypothetical protein